MAIVGDEEDEEAMMQTTGFFFSKLPSDIFLDILSRAPLETLSQCRFVCKTWFYFIHRHRFADMQFAKEIHNNSPSIVVAIDNKHFYLLDRRVFCDFGTSATAYTLQLKEFDQVFSMCKLKDVVGSVNGLMCFTPASYYMNTKTWPYYISNPITGEHLALPNSPKDEMFPTASGFGFASKTSEYKVIRILQHYPHSNPDNLKAEGEIFTLGSDKWRRIEDVPYITSIISNNVLVNENLHWLSDENVQLRQSPLIVSFDVGTERFNAIKPPISGDMHICMSLGVLEGCLCVLDGDFNDRTEIWAMKDYGVHGSWAKEYVVRKEVLGDIWFQGNDMMKLRNGKILVQHGSEGLGLGYYDPNEETFSPIEIQGIFGNNLRPVIHMGSLFSPKNEHR